MPAIFAALRAAGTTFVNWGKNYFKQKAVSTLSSGARGISNSFTGFLNRPQAQQNQQYQTQQITKLPFTSDLVAGIITLLIFPFVFIYLIITKVLPALPHVALFIGTP